ncbi:MAG: hypothetical protein QXO94_06375 [Candidatus Bathyarchaeia archaeon]
MGRPYIGVWVKHDEMLQMGYEDALRFFADCGVTSIRGGVSGAVHPEYYQSLRYQIPAREEPHPTLKEVCAMAREVGIDVEVVIGTFGPSLKEHPEAAILDVLGNRSPSRPCPSNPDVLALTLARIRDIVENNEEIMGLEYDGLYIDMHARMTNPKQPPALYPLHHLAPESCFCEHCKAIAREEGANLERIEGAVKEAVKLSLKPSYEAFRRLYDTFRGQYDVVRYFLGRPELFDWIRLRCLILERAFQAVYETIKSIDPKVTVSHDMLPPTWSWSLAQDYRRHRAYADNFKIIFFNRRTGSYEANPLIAIKDAAPEIPDGEIVELFSRLTGYEGTLSLPAFSQEGFPPMNVYYELRKAREEVGDSFRLIAGIVGDAPARPEDVEAAVEAASRGGADGFCLHTWYGRTTPSNYAAFGNKAREFAKPL